LKSQGHHKMKNDLEMSQAPMDFFHEQASILAEIFELSRQESQYIIASLWGFATYESLERCMSNMKKIIISNEL
jgi:hypothetical protein